jgi:hypothetical protein
MFSDFNFKKCDRVYVGDDDEGKDPCIYLSLAIRACCSGTQIIILL